MIENGYIRFDEKIEEVGDMTGFEPKEDDLEVNCAGTMVVPGFIDIHSHGGYGKIIWMLHRMRLMRWLSR